MCFIHASLCPLHVSKKRYSFCYKVEDAFVDQKGIMQGPTLAALNDDPSVPSISSLRWMDNIETVVRGDSSFADCSVAGRSTFLGDSEAIASASLPACFKQPPSQQLP